MTPCQRCQQAPATPIKPGRLAAAKAKYCATCRAALLRQPVGRLTEAQVTHLLPLLGTAKRDDLAATIGCSRATLHRWLRAHALRSNSQAYPPDVVEAVLRTYERVGRPETAQRFPGVCIRSIVERHPHGARQVRWTPAQRLEAVRMAGLVSPTAQARFFGRPNAFAGSIKALWAKVFQCPPRHINGIGAHLAWQFVLPGCPATMVCQKVAPGPNLKILWLDLVAHLKPSLDPVWRETFEALAAWQTALHHTTSSEDIRRMITEREERYGYGAYASQPPQRTRDRTAGAR